MGWFEEQIRQRKLADQEDFDESFISLASAVLGSRAAIRLSDGRSMSKHAIDRILVYYHKKPAEIPDEITDFDEQLDFALRPHSIMRRRIRLDADWYKHSFGPVLAFRKDSGSAEALIPDSFGIYRCADDAKGKMVRLNRKRMEQFEDEAFCFYYPLPRKSLGIPDLILYMKDTTNFSDLFVYAAMGVAATLVTMIMPAMTRVLTGPVISSGSMQGLTAIAVFIICASISNQLIGVFRSILMNRVHTRTSLCVEAAVMMRVLSLPAGFFRKYSSGELSSRIGSINSLCSYLLQDLTGTMITSITSLLYFFQITSFSKAFLLPSILIIVLSAGVSLAAVLLRTINSKRIMEISARESGMSYGLLSGMRKIRLAGAEKRAFARWSNLYAREARLMYNPPLLIRTGPVIAGAVTLFGNVVLYYTAVRNGVSAADYFAFSASFGMLSGAFSSFTSIISNIAAIKPMLEMAEPILREVPESSENRREITNLNGNIELSNVTFRYDENSPYIIKDLSLKINAGEYVAIVGRTGCGKSTLIRLILGFEKPEKGSIWFDGRDLNTIDPGSLRRKIGTVTQDGKLFNGDIYSNIVISAPQLSVNDAWQAAETAGIADDIRKMPMGMYTVVSEGSGGISGGQKQRLMIARAIVFKPKILIFDEATSALDNITQRKVSDALDRLDCTRLVVAHRLSTIRNCDRILVLDKGNVIEDGTYDELIARNGFFADLVRKQRLDTGTAETEETQDTSAE